MTSTADAPSVIWLELPAVTLPSSLNAGLRFASASTVVSARIPSSAVSTSSVGSALVVAHRDRQDLVLEPALGGGPRRAPVARDAEGVEVLARRAPLVGDHLGAQMPWLTRPPRAS